MNLFSVMMSSMLQWGRNFIVAEMCRHLPALVVCRLASMGPQLYRCGNLANQYVLVPPVVASMGPQLYRCGNVDFPWKKSDIELTLQWGRNFIVAEIRPATLNAVSPDGSFNGAATLSLRKSCQPVCSCTACCRFNGAATSSLRKCRLLVEEVGHRVDASMGPQLYRCGNSR